MDSTAVLRELEALGTEQNRKVYRRHGASEPLMGVSYADLGKLHKRIKYARTRRAAGKTRR